MIRTHILEFHTKGEDEILNITPKIQDVVEESGVNEGSLVLFLQSTTAGLTIMEFEEGLLADLPRAMERIAPKKASYEHEKAYHDGNGHSHILSSLIGTSLVVPFQDKRLLLGVWQQIVLAEFDVRPRKRSIVVQLHGN